MYPNESAIPGLFEHRPGHFTFSILFTGGRNPLLAMGSKGSNNQKNLWNAAVAGRRKLENLEHHGKDYFQQLEFFRHERHFLFHSYNRPCLFWPSAIEISFPSLVCWHCICHSSKLACRDFTRLQVYCKYISIKWFPRYSTARSPMIIPHPPMFSSAEAIGCEPLHPLLHE